MSFYKLISGIFEKIFYSIFMAEKMYQNQFFADISKSKAKVLKLNVVFSTNINIHILVILSYVMLSLPFRSRDKINLHRAKFTDSKIYF